MPINICVYIYMCGTLSYIDLYTLLFLHVYRHVYIYIYGYTYLVIYVGVLNPHITLIQEVQPQRTIRYV